VTLRRGFGCVRQTGKNIGRREILLIPQLKHKVLGPNMSEATILLNAVEQGDLQAAEKLLDLVYEELRRMAASKMAREAQGHTLQPTALVHEAWLRLVASKNPKFENRAHFFSAAAEAMRRILIDRARRKYTQRHGGDFLWTNLGGKELAAPDSDEQLLAVNEVLDVFAKQHPLPAEVVKLRYFVGMTNEETAKALDISVATVKNYWTCARTWISLEIKNL
jgi:RNA polymerase sigma factor (TIGR02999 family)